MFLRKYKLKKYKLIKILYTKLNQIDKFMSFFSKFKCNFGYVKKFFSKF